MNSKKKHIATQLNEHDKKILGKYTDFYTDFIESDNTKVNNLKDERYISEE